ncbi:hypothetical protein K437DRAFT_156557 [Tilletiaria anomala UBC 951]|uniref:RlpA-like protein double-psi beta-barrel domain-containing protein n=1 Tax=Tilletiaria anomala (strain ATCC 24038 / CBS 436.72 / UBC 951) TaxID=1037660 RepID=A0A066VMB1_TILAU|nr:uncharacterized protein K437DRAFT_156557 [Tilletiaria anomala UBC 951]KDN42852.1 hypothetical protein K437DRAFT_156557 [Tilletiaria anomala UBC 951]
MSAVMPARGESGPVLTRVSTLSLVRHQHYLVLVFSLALLPPSLHPPSPASPSSPSTPRPHTPPSFTAVQIRSVLMTPKHCSCSQSDPLSRRRTHHSPYSHLCPPPPFLSGSFLATCIAPDSFATCQQNPRNSLASPNNTTLVAFLSLPPFLPLSGGQHVFSATMKSNFALCAFTALFSLIATPASVAAHGSHNDISGLAVRHHGHHAKRIAKQLIHSRRNETDSASSSDGIQSDHNVWKGVAASGSDKSSPTNNVNSNNSDNSNSNYNDNKDDDNNPTPSSPSKWHTPASFSYHTGSGSAPSSQSQTKADSSDGHTSFSSHGKVIVTHEKPKPYTPSKDNYDDSDDDNDDISSSSSHHNPTGTWKLLSPAATNGQHIGTPKNGMTHTVSNHGGNNTHITLHNGTSSVNGTAHKGTTLNNATAMSPFNKSDGKFNASLLYAGDVFANAKYLGNGTFACKIMQSTKVDGAIYRNVTYTPKEMSAWTKKQGVDVCHKKPVATSSSSHHSTAKATYSGSAASAKATHKASNAVASSPSYDSVNSGGSSGVWSGSGGSDGSSGDEVDCDEEDDNGDDGGDDNNSNVSKPSSAASKATSNVHAAATASSSSSNSKSSSVSTSSSSSSSSGSLGQWISNAFATYYLQNNNAGSCGKVHSDSDRIVALTPTYNGNNQACGKQVRICVANNKSKCVTATVADLCPTCITPNSIDLSRGTFQALESNLGVGQFAITWAFSN